jgi:multicomponent Na+:H+ antiporter subunit G
VVFFIAGAVALIRFPDALIRLHAQTKAESLGLGLIVLGLLPWVGCCPAALSIASSPSPCVPGVPRPPS